MPPSTDNAVKGGGELRYATKDECVSRPGSAGGASHATQLMLVIVGRPPPEPTEHDSAGLTELLGRRYDTAVFLGLQAEIIGDGRHTDHGDGGAEGRLLRRDLVVRHGCSSSRPGVVGI